MYRVAGYLIALAAVSAPLAGQGWIEIERPPVRMLNPPSVLRVSSDVRVTVQGRVAQVEVEESFRNTGGTMGEGTYLYPLPGEAVFQNFSLWMGDQELKGEVMKADDARKIYEEIVRRQRDPALLTLAGHGLVRAQVFPIQPGETRKVVLRYTQVLDRAGDALRVRYALGNRGEASTTFHLTVPRADDYGVPYSPTHEIASRREQDRLEVRVDPKGAGDLELLLPLRRGLVGTSVLAHAPGGEDGYFMLLLAPPVSDQGQVVPRDLSFVVDVSGSMAGTKLEQVKEALQQALGTLRPEDRFRLIAFNSTVREFHQGYSSATRENLQAAREFTDRLVADGGTNIAGALDAVLGGAVAEDRLPIMLFLTDGLPSVGEQEPDRIATQAAARIGRTRIFTFGVGEDVNTYLLDRLARDGRGSPEYVSSGSSVEQAVGRVVNKISRPALVNLHIVNAPVRLSLLSPATLPDLFYGEELVVFGRYDGAGQGSLEIEGERNGRRERLSTQAVFPAAETGNDFIPRLWASRRIGDLTRQIRLEGGGEELVREVRDLGLRYGILTEYTSYLVQEPTPFAVREDRAPAAPAPRDQVGTMSFGDAQASAALSKASTLAAADAAADEKMGRLDGAGSAMKRVGGRVFIQRGGVWTDALQRDSLGTVAVAPYSEAYFILTRALPELAQYFALGEEVLVAGRRLSIRVTATGASQLSPAELARAVRGFRGTA
jgi:Ca-activated chloride channel family protein